MNQNTILLTVPEVADLLRVSSHTVYYWVSRSEIPHLKVGKHLRFSKEDVLAFFRLQTEQNAKHSTCMPDIDWVRSTAKPWSLKTNRDLADSSTKGIGNGNR